MKIVNFASLGLFLLLVACAEPSIPQATQPSQEIVQTRQAPVPTEAQKQACTKEGGEMKQGGIMGSYLCVKPYDDAGKVCRDDADCKGKCLAELGTPQSNNGKQTGQCQANSMHFGCYAEVKSGNIGPGLCVD
jgi:hypothetical protein